jgi:glycerol-3-phosphate dehydrogenase (NAD(P)+)
VTINRVAIIGAGAWGTALANAISDAGRAVTLVARDARAANEIARDRESPRLPGIKLRDAVTLAAGTVPPEPADVIVLAVPAQAMRDAATTLGPVPATTPLVICAKGIERGSRKFMTEVIAEVRPETSVAILSGPSFATDVACGRPVAITLAANDESRARDLALALGAPTFRLYHSTDMRGVEIGGAAKNVLAIAAGIVTGRKLGPSAAAALTTRGFAELMRFARTYDARPETITGLSGLGDLILTCSSTQSRNFSLGIALGEGCPPPVGKLTEGAFTASALVALAQARNVDMPIASAVNAVLNRSMSVEEAIDMLLMRPFKAE